MIAKKFTFFENRCLGQNLFDNETLPAYSPFAKLIILPNLILSRIKPIGNQKKCKEFIGKKH